MWRFEIYKTRSNYKRSYLSVRKDIPARQCGVRGIVIMWKDEVGMSVGCLMRMIIGGNWRNSEVVRRSSNGKNDYRGNYTRMVVKEISGSTTGIDFRRMIEDLTIGDTNLEMGVKNIILLEGTAEIEVRVRILVEAIRGKGDD
ncbi:uncharacterized protein TNCV_4395241 [Trichonephila clavipes]|uniref:Uncharacterized protein n=1 Tax=Trichonephila clavipes TaxID=2585209 RepID=A0A8X6W4K6_TRICX|nr:uncharacterized protein TNCV_4395241 [Trichonephila clavipes]